MLDEYRFADAAQRIFGPLRDWQRESEQELITAERRLGLKLPQVLRDYYLLLGRHRNLNHRFHHLRLPARLEVRQNALVFFSEAQSVMLWGVSIDCIADNDPPVIRAISGPNLEWKFDTARMSGFLVLMVYWQAIMGGAYIVARKHNVSENVLANVSAKWPKEELGETSRRVEVFSQRGQALVFEGGRQLELNVACATTEDFQQVNDQLELAWDFILESDGEDDRR